MPCFARSVERVEQGIFCLWHFIYPFCKFMAFNPSEIKKSGVVVVREGSKSRKMIVR